MANLPDISRQPHLSPEVQQALTDIVQQPGAQPAWRIMLDHLTACTAECAMPHRDIPYEAANGRTARKIMTFCRLLRELSGASLLLSAASWCALLVFYEGDDDSISMLASLLGFPPSRKCLGEALRRPGFIAAVEACTPGTMPIGRLCLLSITAESNFSPSPDVTAAALLPGMREIARAAVAGQQHEDHSAEKHLLRAAAELLHRQALIAAESDPAALRDRGLLEDARRLLDAVTMAMHADMIAAADPKDLQLQDPESKSWQKLLCVALLFNMMGLSTIVKAWGATAVPTAEPAVDVLQQTPEAAASTSLAAILRAMAEATTYQLMVTVKCTDLELASSQAYCGAQSLAIVCSLTADMTTAQLQGAELLGPLWLVCHTAVSHCRILNERQDAQAFQNKAAWRLPRQGNRERPDWQRNCVWDDVCATACMAVRLLWRTVRGVVRDFTSGEAASILHAGHVFRTLELIGSHIPLAMFATPDTSKGPRGDMVLRPELRMLIDTITDASSQVAAADLGQRVSQPMVEACASASVSAGLVRLLLFSLEVDGWQNPSMDDTPSISLTAQLSVCVADLAVRFAATQPAAFRNEGPYLLLVAWIQMSATLLGSREASSARSDHVAGDTERVCDAITALAQAHAITSEGGAALAEILRAAEHKLRQPASFPVARHRALAAVAKAADAVARQQEAEFRAMGVPARRVGMRRTARATKQATAAAPAADPAAAHEAAEKMAALLLAEEDAAAAGQTASSKAARKRAKKKAAKAAGSRAAAAPGGASRDDDAVAAGSQPSTADSERNLPTGGAAPATAASADASATQATALTAAAADAATPAAHDGSAQTAAGPAAAATMVAAPESSQQQIGSAAEPTAAPTASVEQPPWMFCPLTKEVMRDPVVAGDGISYERKAIAAWLAAGKTTSPSTGAPLQHMELLPNRALKCLIDGAAMGRA